MAIGVEVTTSLRSGPSNPGVQSGRLHIAGLTEFGPVGAGRVIRSIAQYLAAFGDRTPYSSAMFDTARLFFEEGGSELVVSRVVGSAAASGTLLLKDKAGTPIDTLRIDAVEPGNASARLAIAVESGSETFDVIVTRDGEIVTRFRELTSPTDLVSRAAGNDYIKVTSLGSASVTPTNNPATLPATALSAGSDDRSSVTVASVIEALEAAGDAANGGAVAAPGYTVETIGAQLAAHAKGSHKIALVAATQPGATRAEAESAVDQFADNGSGDAIGVFYPSLRVPDGSSTRVVGPEGYVAAVRAKAHRDRGFWQVPAGDFARLRWALGTDVPVDPAMNNVLSESKVNGIVTTGTKTRLYGYQSLSDNVENLGLLRDRDVLNNLSIGVEEILEPFVWGTNDSNGMLLSGIESAVTGYLDPMAKRGAFYARINEGGEQVDPGYRVVVDSSLNTVQTASENKAIVNVAIRLSPAAQLIQVEIIKVPLAASV